MITHEDSMRVGRMLADYYYGSHGEGIKRYYTDAVYYTHLLDELGPQLESAVKEYLAKI